MGVIVDVVVIVGVIVGVGVVVNEEYTSTGILLSLFVPFPS